MATRLRRVDRLAVAAPRPADVAWIMQRLRSALPGLDAPAVEKIARQNRKRAFRVLIGTLLSARTQDATTHAASMRLFRRAQTPKAMERLSVREIQGLIYPVSFYRTKARHVKETCRLLMQRFGGQVPDTMEQLLTLPGVGRKTANLVLILAHGSLENICVDTHVHRISNRLGWVATRTPEQTEQALYRAIPRRWWPDVNLYLVTWGQNVCRPINPRCRACVLAARCPSVRR
jgi:endonuclease-3